MDKFVVFLLSIAIWSHAAVTHADMAPGNSRAIEHTVTIHGLTAFPNHRFILTGLWMNWPAPQELKEGQTLPFLKFGGALFAVPKAKWKKHFSRGKAPRQSTNKQLSRRGYPKTATKIFVKRYIPKPTDIRRMRSKILIRKIIGKTISFVMISQAYNKDGEPISAQKTKKKRSKGKKTSLRQEQPGPWYMAMLPPVFVVMGLLGLFVMSMGARRRNPTL